MKKDEWVNKSVEERRDWYLRQIDQLQETLTNSNSDPQASNEYLKAIKTRMVFDSTPSNNRDADPEEDYYSTIYKAYKTLPNFDDGKDKWPIALDKVQGLFSE